MRGETMVCEDDPGQPEALYAESPVLQRHLDESVEFAVQLARAVAEVKQCGPTELPPIQEWVACEAIERLLTSGPGDRHLRIEFEYSGVLVSINRDRVASIYRVT